jgi:hypothetical protein
VVTSASQKEHKKIKSSCGIKTCLPDYFELSTQHADNAYRFLLAKHFKT